jgi:hypothetical protein
MEEERKSKWASCDPSNNMGWAFWENDNLLYTATLRRMGKKGKYRYNTSIQEHIYDSKWMAVSEILKDAAGVIIEEGFGRFATAVKSQSGYREYIHAVCDYYTHVGTPKRFEVINVAEWRRVIKETYEVSWPATTERKKVLSMQLVKKIYDVDVSDDESDAVLIGLAAIKMGVKL